MPREIRPEVSALIESGRFGYISMSEVSLSSGQIYLSTGRFEIPEGEEILSTKAYLEIGSALVMNLGVESDVIEFGIQNLTSDIRELVSGEGEDKLDGSWVRWGVLFLDLETRDIFFDKKISGKLFLNEVKDLLSSFTLFSETDVTMVSGRIIAEVFPWREPIQSSIFGIGPIIPGTDDPGDLERPDRPGRYGERDDVMFRY